MIGLDVIDVSGLNDNTNYKLLCEHLGMLGIRNYTRLVSGMSKKFVNGFYDTFDIDENKLFKQRFVVDANKLIKWIIYFDKKDFLNVLKTNFKLGFDYSFIINDVYNRKKSHDELVNMANDKLYLKTIGELNKSNNNSSRKYYLTLDCAKFIALSANKGKRARLIKKYFIAMENAMIMFKDVVLKRVLERYQNLARSVSPTFNIIGNMLYLIRRVFEGKVYFKMGITLDLLKRAMVYNSGTMDFAEYIFVIYSSNADHLESCSKVVLKQYKLFKKRELLNKDVGSIINTILTQELIINRLNEGSVSNNFDILNKGDVVDTLKYNFNNDIRVNSKIITDLMNEYKPLVIKSPYYTKEIKWFENKQIPKITEN